MSEQEILQSRACFLLTDIIVCQLQRSEDHKSAISFETTAILLTLRM
jgi:hypothetical protein